MRCGYCKAYEAKGIASFLKHLKDCGPLGGREVWQKHLDARDHGRSGRRILSRYLPSIFPPKPMDERDEARLRELKEKRRGMNVGRKGRRGRRIAAGRRAGR